MSSSQHHQLDFSRQNLNAMASSAPKIAEAERTEADDVVDQKAQELVDLITKSKHFIAFTGAGVSTSAGEFPIYPWGKKREDRGEDTSGSTRQD